VVFKLVAAKKMLNVPRFFESFFLRISPIALNCDLQKYNKLTIFRKKTIKLLEIKMNKYFHSIADFYSPYFYCPDFKFQILIFQVVAGH